MLRHTPFELPTTLAYPRSGKTFSLSVPHRLIRVGWSSPPSLWRAVLLLRLHRHRLTASSTHRLDIGSVRQRLLEVADAARDVFVPLHGERYDGLTDMTRRD